MSLNIDLLPLCCLNLTIKPTEEAFTFYSPTLKFIDQYEKCVSYNKLHHAMFRHRLLQRPVRVSEVCVSACVVLCLVCTLCYLKRDVCFLRGGVQAPVVAGLCIKLLEDPATNTDERTREVASRNNNNPTWRLKGFRSAAESIFWLNH